MTTAAVLSAAGFETHSTDRYCFTGDIDRLNLIEFIKQMFLNLFAGG